LQGDLGLIAADLLILGRAKDIGPCGSSELVENAKDLARYRDYDVVDDARLCRKIADVDLGRRLGSLRAERGEAQRLRPSRL
jgi:hypothetical protein